MHIKLDRRRRITFSSVPSQVRWAMMMMTTTLSCCVPFSECHAEYTIHARKDFKSFFRFSTLPCLVFSYHQTTFCVSPYIYFSLWLYTSTRLAGFYEFLMNQGFFVESWLESFLIGRKCSKIQVAVKYDETIYFFSAKKAEKHQSSRKSMAWSDTRVLL